MAAVYPAPSTPPEHAEDGGPREVRVAPRVHAVRARDVEHERVAHHAAAGREAAAQVGVHDGGEGEGGDDGAEEGRAT